MSQPQFPSTPDLTRQSAVNQVLSSIAAEELSLSHVINTEGEKIQYAVGTIPGLEGGATIEDALRVNDSVGSLLGTVLENQFLLNGKLSDAVQAPVFAGPQGPTGPTGPQGSATGPTGPSGPVGEVGPFILGNCKTSPSIGAKNKIKQELSHYAERRPIGQKGGVSVG